MADKKLNEVTKVTDMAYVPVIMSDGSIGQIAKADLASVVAGIMPYSVQGGESSISDFNELKTGGLWSITSETNRPDPLYKYWEVNVTVGKDGTILQQAKVKAGGNSGIYSRMYRSKEKDWTSWTQQFGYNSLAELAGGIGSLLPFNEYSNVGTRTLSGLDTNSADNGVYIVQDDSSEFYGIALVYSVVGHCTVQIAISANKFQFRRSKWGSTTDFSGISWNTL